MFRQLAQPGSLLLPVLHYAFVTRCLIVGVDSDDSDAGTDGSKSAVPVFSFIWSIFLTDAGLSTWPPVAIRSEVEIVKLMQTLVSRRLLHTNGHSHNV